MRALVTGGTGFIGYHLIQELLARNWKIKCLVRETSVIPEEYMDKIEFVTGDLTRPASLTGITENIDVIFHLAGKIKALNLSEFKKVNTEGTKNLLESIPQSQQASIRFIFISSMSALGPATTREPLSEEQSATPVSYYGQSKLLAENLVRNSGLNYRIIRPAAVYGPGDKETLSFFQLAAKHINAKIGLKQHYLSLIHVLDLVNLIMKATLTDIKDQVYHAADNSDGYAYSKIIQTAAKSINSWTLSVYIPQFLLKIAAYFASLWSKLSGQVSIFNLDKYNEIKQQYWLINSRKAQNQLNFKPEYDIRRGFAETVQWYQKQGWI
ncbi:MAG: NAD(P)-dependent oxidoreductase [Candidatus Marinimicrobia bacterium]|nr:NAD(P)-dependent oxidoreductase [Candidatus Neomarinimicrobiota bacterium]